MRLKRGRAYLTVCMVPRGLLLKRRRKEKRKKRNIPSPGILLLRATKIAAAFTARARKKSPRRPYAAPPRANQSLLARGMDSKCFPYRWSISSISRLTR
jgi:hypothetical protein